MYEFSEVSPLGQNKLKERKDAIYQTSVTGWLLNMYVDCRLKVSFCGFNVSTLFLVDITSAVRVVSYLLTSVGSNQSALLASS